MSFIKRRWAGWNRAQRIGWTSISVFVALVFIGAVASGNDETTKAAPASVASPSVPTSSSTTSTSASSISAWAGDVSSWSSELADAMGTISTLLSDESFQTRLLLGDSDANLEIAVPLVVLQRCSETFPSAPSHQGAQRIERTVFSACDSYERAASLFMRGVDNQDSETLYAAGDALIEGMAMIKVATSQVRDLAS